MTASESADPIVTATSTRYGTSEPVIEIEGLSVVYDGGVRGDIHALHNIDLSANKGDFVCLVGRSGCGKSTLLKTIAGFLEPTHGTVTVSGQVVRGPGRDRGMVFQEYALFPWRTAFRNVMFGLERSGMDKRAAMSRAREYLKIVGLEGFEDVYPHQLSGGMKQRVAIARALAYRPEILLMDEPFAAVDAFTRQQLQQLMVNVWQETGATVFYVTHDIPEAIFLSERVVVMTPQPGRIHAVKEVNLARPRDPLDPAVMELAREVRDLVFHDM
jgi:NitT/TauT family transport system ATP-binding protein